MGRLLPFETEPTERPGEPRVLDLDDEATEAALSALSSDTARKILSEVYEEPRTPPELRDETDTSLQNVHYHLENLEEADLIQPAGSGYSEKGTEMTVYAPASEAVVLFAGQEHHRSRLKTALTRLLGAVGILGLAALLLDRVADLFVGMGASGDEAAPTGDGADGANGDAGGGDDVGVQMATEAADTVSTSPEPFVDPAIAFFVGGLFMLLLVSGWLYWRR